MTDDKTCKLVQKEMKAVSYAEGRPKRPGNSFALYVKDVNQTSKIPATVAIKTYKALPQFTRKQYETKYAALMKQYNVDLVKWEKKMISEGKAHLVRKKSVPKEGRKNQ